MLSLLIFYDFGILRETKQYSIIIFVALLNDARSTRYWEIYAHHSHHTRHLSLVRRRIDELLKLLFCALHRFVLAVLG